MHDNDRCFDLCMPSVTEKADEAIKTRETAGTTPERQRHKKHHLHCSRQLSPRWYEPGINKTKDSNWRLIWAIIDLLTVNISTKTPAWSGRFKTRSMI